MPPMMRHARSLWLVETRAAESPWPASIAHEVATLCAPEVRRLDANPDCVERFAGEDDGPPLLAAFRAAVRVGLDSQGALHVIDASDRVTELLESSLAQGPWRRCSDEWPGFNGDPYAARRWSLCMLIEAAHAGVWAGRLLVDMARPLPTTLEVRELRRVLTARPTLAPLFRRQSVYATLDRVLNAPVVASQMEQSIRGRWIHAGAAAPLPFERQDQAAVAWMHWVCARTVDESLRRGLGCALEDSLPDLRAARYIWAEWPELICSPPFPAVKPEHMQQRWLPRSACASAKATLEAIADEAACRGYLVGLELARTVRADQPSPDLPRP